MSTLVSDQVSMNPGAHLERSWQTDARLCLLAQAPNPCTVGGVVIGLTTHERG